MSATFSKVLQVIFYYIIWFVTIKFAANGFKIQDVLFVGILIALQYSYQFWSTSQRRSLNLIIFYFVLLGIFVDSLFLWLGVISFKANDLAPYIAAPWMVALWISFAILFHSTLMFLITRYFLTAILAFFGFSLAYFFGAWMGAAFFPHGFFSCLYIGLAYAIAFPTLLFIYRQVNSP